MEEKNKTNVGPVLGVSWQVGQCFALVIRYIGLVVCFVLVFEVESEFRSKMSRSSRMKVVPNWSANEANGGVTRPD